MIKLCGFDIETPQEIPEYALQPWRARTGEATIKSVAIWKSDTVKGSVRMPSREWFRKFLVSCAENKVVIVTWNGLFELSWLHALGLTKEINACTWMDAMLLLKRIDGWRNRDLGGRGYGLKDVVAKRWPEHAEYGLGDDVTKVPATDEEWNRLLDYNLLDSEFTCKLAMEYLEQLSPEEQRAARQEAIGLSPIALSYINGISINTEALEVLEVDVAARRIIAEGKLNVPADVIASPKKLGKLLYEEWGFAVALTTPTGAPSTDKEALLTLELEHPDDPRLRELLDVRKCNTQQAKFVDAVKESIKYHGENITRPSPFIAGTYTGRMTYASKQGKGKTERQTGIALHQWERGKGARNILQAPEGFLIAEFDASGQEMRLMADASEDEMMLKLFTEGIDGHAYMGAQIEGKEWQWVSGEQDKDPEAKRIRNLGKFCVAEGELVLTSRGLVPIEEVLLADKVWDGVEWVTHTGVVDQGDRDVITYQGLTATPDHRVYISDSETCMLGSAANSGHRITVTEHGGVPIQSVGNSISNSVSDTSEGVSGLRVPVRISVTDTEHESGIRKVKNVLLVREKDRACTARACSDKRCSVGAGAEEVQCDEAEVSESKGRIVQQLWCERDSVQVQERCRSYSICPGKSTSSYISRCSDRSGGQQRSLRAGEFEAGHANREHAEYTGEQLCASQRCADTTETRLPRTENSVARSEVHRTGGDELGIKSNGAVSDTGSVSSSGESQTKRTYDITNAGPRHRFTVSGVLVSNCNLSLQYRIGTDTIRVRALTQYGLNLTYSKADHMKHTYLSTYKGVPRYWKSAIACAARDRYAVTRGHRRIALKNLNIYEQQQTAINFPIQGTGGDMKELAIAVLQLTEFNDDVLYAWDLHDALFLFVRDDDRARTTVTRIRDRLNNLPYQAAWGWTPLVSLPWDAKMGKSWGSLKGI